MEKLYINNSIGDERLLNKQSEFVSKCRHQNKLLIKKRVIKRQYGLKSGKLYFVF